MPKIHSISANGTAFQAKSGDVLLDSALLNGVEYPHDCRAGRCGSCLSKVVRGITIGGETGQKGMVHACQARAFSDVVLEFADLPPVVSVEAELAGVVERALDVVELDLKLSKPFHYLPGQYSRFKFKGFPARSFSPTAPLSGEAKPGHIYLNVKRVRGGKVSPALGNAIGVGHRVTVEGPFGTAFYRPDEGHRLVLVAGGTGFAPIWSIATAALKLDPNKPIVVIAGTRRDTGLYMGEALVWLNKQPNVEIIPTANEHTVPRSFIRKGGPADHLPPLKISDLVYAAGAPAMVDHVAAAADAVGAAFYCDPFAESAAEPRSLLGQLFGGSLFAKASSTSPGASA